MREGGGHFFIIGVLIKPKNRVQRSLLKKRPQWNKMFTVRYKQAENGDTP